MSYGRKLFDGGLLLLPVPLPFFLWRLVLCLFQLHAVVSGGILLGGLSRVALRCLRVSFELGQIPVRVVTRWSSVRWGLRCSHFISDHPWNRR